LIALDAVASETPANRATSDNLARALLRASATFASLPTRLDADSSETYFTSKSEIGFDTFEAMEDA
jgi:hypothetical protein